MDFPFINRIHAHVEDSLAVLGIHEKIVYIEDMGDHVIVTIYFKRPGSKHPEANRRIDIYSRAVAKFDEITSAIIDALEDEWRHSVEHGMD